ncbi:MAG: metal-dependent transcriptional regulator [Lachnospiraceae bacterium]|nr:metal-dependent transcriptional regulator [Lachnospiraceae bacterium]
MNESAAKYIKAIYALKQRCDCVRSVDVARELGVTKASVSIAMANLRKSKMIEMKESGEIMLTQDGETIAVDIYERSRILSDFLRRIAGVDEATAIRDAGKMERFMSRATYEGIKRFIKKDLEAKKRYL